MHVHDLTLEEKVAQLFMVGFSGNRPQAVTERFLEAGVGGVIFFRDNFDSLTPQTAQSCAQLLEDLKNKIPAHLPRPFFSIDQEGGQVERLPHTFFPTGVTPRAVALSRTPEKLAAELYDMMSAHLSLLGFNMDFFPTLDVNFERTNPIIGVRAFADSGPAVWPLAKIALQQFEKNHVVTVGKHFPGHGNGTVDSHIELPVLHFTEEELAPFRQAIEAGLPAVLVSHGFYPELQTDPSEKNLPASASPTVLQNLLRERCGFKGVIITDDLCMGAITKLYGPVEAALMCLRAGADILLYKQSTEAEWEVYEAVLQAYRTGALSLENLDASVARLLALKAKQPVPLERQMDLIAEIFAPDRVQRLADQIASKAISVLYRQPENLFPLCKKQPVLLVHPDRSTLGNYAFDVPTSPELPDLFEAAGFEQVHSFRYDFRQAMKDFRPDAGPEPAPGIILFISFNPLIHGEQQTLLESWRRRYPESHVIVASAGTPYDGDVFPDVNAHLVLCSYRPATMRQLPQWLLSFHP